MALGSAIATCAMMPMPVRKAAAPPVAFLHPSTTTFASASSRAEAASRTDAGRWASRGPGANARACHEGAAADRARQVAAVSFIVLVWSCVLCALCFARLFLAPVTSYLSQVTLEANL